MQSLRLAAACTLAFSLGLAAALAPGCGGGPKPFKCTDPEVQGCICNPGETGCVANTFSVCDDEGKAYLPQTDCGSGATANVCVVERGCLECFPNKRRCRGFDIHLCAADGFGERLVGSCAPSLGEVCFDGECVNACNLAAANKSYEGCEYYAVDLDNAGISNALNAAGQQFAVVVSNPSPLEAIVTVERNTALPGAVPVVEQVLMERLDPGQLRILKLAAREVDGSTPGVLDDGPGTFLSSNAYRIKSTAPIVAYQFNPLENVNVFSNDASLLIPTAALDTQYIVMGWPQTIATTGDAATNFDDDLRATLTIVGVRDGLTTVEINSKADIIAGRDSAGNMIMPRFAGENFEIKLGPFDVINLETGGFNADFTGTFLRADQPIAVFSGSEASDVPTFPTLSTRQCCADHLEEQLFPLSTAGTRFVAVKSADRSKAVREAGGAVSVIREKEWFRVLGTEEFTTVITSLPPPNDRFTVTGRQFKTIEADRDFIISATAPVIVGQFNGSQATTGIPSNLPGGDPAFTLLPPVEQFRVLYHFLVPDKYAFDFLLISAPVGARIEYDGAPLADAIPGCVKNSAGVLKIESTNVEYEAIVCSLSKPRIIPDRTPPMNVDPGAQDDDEHTLSADKPIGLVVYGFDSFVSYSYPGGADLRLINLR